ncbi:macro domain-containing protein [Streptomyces virginiae]|uniref:macro domain-containing protein n=1 Tax=Streptomyces virginiae TaxID=1961 RepID=UPI001FCB2889|nr:macro domain-containing protein [Streptomyces virginiae]
MAVGLSRALPSSPISHSFTHPEFEVTIKKGDLFDETGNLVIGFTDTFDTDMIDGIVISRSSVQGQFQERYYNDDTAGLNSELNAALRGQRVIGIESPEVKQRGKLERYPIGTVAVLNEGNRKAFCFAYGQMGNSLLVSCTVDSLWASLTILWAAVREHGQRHPLALPIIGTDMARIGTLGRESLLKMILLSFAAHSRQEEITPSLTLVIHPKDFEKYDMLELRSFIQAL